MTAALASLAASRGLRVAVCKPAQTGVGDGEPGDLAEIVRLTGTDIETVELARYPDPLAPDTAARRSGRPLLDLDRTVDAVRTLEDTADLVLVEGAGGVLVRLGAAGFTLVDLAGALGAPTVVVVAAGLGTLNHSALTVGALRAAAVECRGLVIGSSPATPDLAERCNVGDLPDGHGCSTARFRTRRGGRPRVRGVRARCARAGCVTFRSTDGECATTRIPTPANPGASHLVDHESSPLPGRRRGRG